MYEKSLVVFKGKSTRRVSQNKGSGGCRKARKCATIIFEYLFIFGTMQSTLMTVKVTTDLLIKVKQRALDERKKMWEVVAEALNKHLNT